MSYKLLIYNPSKEPRGGVITVPWQPIAAATGYSPDGLKLTQDDDTELKYYQVDQIDPDNPAHDRLSFFLGKPLGRGPEDYSKPSGFVTIEGIKGKKQRKEPVSEYKKSIELSNMQLDARFNLTPESDGGGFWYAGSVTSVRLEKCREEGHRIEYLDYPTAHAEWLSRDRGHDPEKRCLQLESIEIAHPNMERGPFQKIYLFNQPYRVVSECSGPVRKCLAIASKPFYYNAGTPPTGSTAPLECELMRIFTLYEDREFILEELFINVKPPAEPVAPKHLGLHFIARYFSYMCMDAPSLVRRENVPDWFSIADLFQMQGYGFATDVHVAQVELPHSAYHDQQNRVNAFSFTLHPATAANCLHLFSRFDAQSDLPLEASVPLPDNLHKLQIHAAEWCEKRIGQHWYEYIYKPLRAQSAKQGEAYAF
jgi:hypothetical protein